MVQRFSLLSLSVAIDSQIRYLDKRRGKTQATHIVSQTSIFLSFLKAVMPMSVATTAIKPHQTLNAICSHKRKHIHTPFNTQTTYKTQRNTYWMH